MKRALLVLALATLAGCQSAEEIAADDNANCIGRGFAYGSDTYEACRMLLSEMRRTEDSQSNAAALMIMGQGLNNAARTYQAAPVPTTTYEPYRSRNIWCQSVGPTTNCSGF